MRWTIANGVCADSFDEVVIRNDQNPTTANAGPDQMLCDTNAATLAGNTATVGTGTWTVANGTATITSPNSATSTITGLVTPDTVVMVWTIANGVCADSRDTVVIRIDAEPTIANAGTDQMICDTNSTTLAGNTPVVGTGTWSVISGTATITSPNDPTSTVTGLVTPDTVTLRWTIANGVCTDTQDDVVIRIDEQPTTANAGPDQMICDTNAATLAGNTITVGTGTWTVVSGTATITSPNSPTSTITGLVTPDTVTLRWTSVNGVCSTFDEVVVRIDAEPTLANAGADQMICDTSATTLAGNTATVGIGTWTVVSGTATITDPNNPATTITGLVTPDTVTLRWTIANGVCTDTQDDVVIRIDAEPTVANAGADQMLCDTNATTLAGNTATVGTGTWTLISGTATITDPNNPTTTITGLVTPDTVTLRWTIANGVCADTQDDVVIRIDAEPTVATAGPDQMLCEATSTTLAGNTPTVGIGTWTVASGTATITNPNAPTSSITGLSAPDTITLRWTISNGVCTDTQDDVVIRIDQNPTTANAGVDQMICDTNATTLAGNTPTVGTGTWTVVSGTATITSPNDPTSTVTGLVTPDTVTLRWTISNGVCTNSFDEVTIRIDEQPTTANAGSDQMICDTNATTLAGNTITVGTGTWSLISGTATITSPNSPTSTVTGLVTPDTVTLRWTSTNGVCISTDDVVIRIDAEPTVANAGADQMICDTNSTTLTGNTALVGTGTWSLVSGTATITNPNDPTSTVTGLVTPDTVTLRWTIANGVCTDSQDDVVIRIDQQPTTANAGPDQMICDTNATTLAGNTITVGTGTWSLISGTATITSPNSPTSTITGLVTPDTVTLRWTSTNGVCTSTDDVVIRIDANPTTANAGADQMICDTSATTLAGNAPTIGTGTWSVVSGTATITSPNSPTSTITGLVTPDTVTLRWTISNGVCTDSFDDVVIRIDQQPTTANAGPDQMVCDTNATTLTGNTVTVGTGTWSLISGTATITSPNSPTSTITGLVTPDTVTLRWTTTNGVCTSTDDVVIHINADPTTANAGADQMICDTNATTLAGNTATIGTGTWTVVSGTATITSPNSPTSTITGLVTPDTVTLRWTISNGVCTDSFDDVVIRIDQQPTTANAGPDQMLCDTNATTLAGNTITVGAGTWSVVSGTATITSPNSPTSTVTGLVTPDTVTLRWTSTNGVCTSTDDVVIRIDANPTTANAGPDQMICAASSATLAGNAPTVGTGTWTVISGTATITSPNNPTSTITGLVTPDTVTLRWTISNGVCTDSFDDVVIRIDANPTTANAGADQMICAASSATLAGNAPTVGTGTWTVVSGTATITSPNSPTSTITGLVTPDTVTLRWTIANGVCTDSFDDVVIRIDQNPTTANAGADQTLCAASSTTLTGNTVTVGTGTWSVVSGTATITSPNSPTSTITGLVTPDTVTLRWTTTNGVCSSFDDVVIQIDQNPTTANAGADQMICTASSTTLAGNAPTVGTGTWTVVSGTATITSPNSPTSTITGLVTPDTVTLRWTIANGVCTDSFDEVVIRIDDNPTTANAGPDQTLCAASSATLAGNAPTVGTGTWTVVSGTATITSPNSPTSTITGLVTPDTVTLRWTIANGVCTDSFDDVVIRIDDNPTTANAGPDQMLCTASSATLAGNAPTVGTGTWTIVSGTATITSPNSPTSTITGLVTPDTVTLRWTIANGVCTDSFDDVVIRIDDNPTTANAGPDQMICTASSATLAGNAPTVGTGTWTVVSGTATITSPNSPTSTITGLVTPDTVTLRWTIANGVCTDSFDDVVIRIDDNPTTANAGPDQMICTASSATLAGNAPTVGTGTWTVVSGTATITNPNDPASTITGLVTPDTVTLRWTIANGVCTDSFDEVVIRIDDNPTTANAGPDQTLCTATSATLAANTPGVGTGTWTVVSGTATITNPNDPASTITGLVTPDTVTLRWTIANGVCTDSFDDVVIRIDDNPTTANAGPDQMICALSSATLAGNTPTVGTGTWTVVSGTATITNPNDPTSTITGLVTPDTVTLRWTIANGVCTDSFDDVVIRIDDNPTTANAGPDQMLCTASSATLAGNAPTVGTGTWTIVSGTATITSPNSPTSTITGLVTPDTVTLRWTIVNGVCTDSFDDVVIRIDDNPTMANAGPDQMICAASSATLAGNAPTVGTGTWTVVSGTATITSPSSPTSTITGLVTPDTVTLRWTIANGVCTDSFDDVVIRIDDNPTTANAGPDQMLCTASSATLAGNAPTVGTGTWTIVSGTATITSPNSPTSTITGLVTPDTVTLRWTIANGVCTDSFDDVVIRIDDNPTTANAGADQTLCTATSATLAANTPGVGTGTWTVVSGTATITNPNDPASTITGLVTPDTVTLRWTIANGVCTDSFDDVVIRIDDNPTTANAGPDQTLCTATSATLAANTPGVGTGTWTVVSGTATITNPNDPTSTITGLVTPDTVTLRWTIANGVCTDSFDDVIIRIDDNPTTANAGPDQTLCTATSATLAANTPGVGTGTWTVVSGTATITNPNDPTSTITGLVTPDTVTLRWTIANGVCTDSFDDVVIRIDDNPTTANAGPDQTLCTATSATLAANTPGVGTGTWTVVSGTATITNPNDPTSTITGLVTPDTVTLRWTIANGVCTDSFDDVVIRIDDNPTTANAGPDQTLCAVSSATLAGNTPTVGTGTWTVVSGTATITNPNDPTSIITGLVTPDTVTLRWTISNGVCTDSFDDVVIRIDANPSIANAGADQTLCAATSATLAGNTPGVGIGTWTVVSGTATITNPNDPTSTITGLVTPDTVTLRWTISNGVCTDSFDDVVIQIDQNPSTANAGPDQSLCTASSATLAGNVPTVGTGTWTVVSGTATITNPNDPASTITGLVTPSTVTLRWTIANGVCTDSFDEVDIVINQLATADAGMDASICSNETYTLAGSIGGAAGSLTWTTSGDGSFSNASSATAVYTPGPTDISNGSVTLTLTTDDPAGPCPAATDQMTLNIGSTPQPDFSWANSCLGSTTSFTNLTPPVAVGTIISYSWDFGDMNTSSSANPTHTYTAAGQYQVTLTVTTDLTCVDSITQTVFILPVQTPTASSPYSEDFESGAGAWVSEGSNSSWERATPAGTTINAAASGSNAWITNASGAYNDNESSSVNSPCFSLDSLDRPMIALSIWSDNQQGFDGAVLQSSIDDGTSWQNVGALNSGVNWFNEANIIGNPGNQTSNQHGWSGTDAGWLTARHSLDHLKGAASVRFRIAFGSDGSNPTAQDGFAFDDVWIGERSRTVLLEHFTNLNATGNDTVNSAIYSRLNQNDSDLISIQHHTAFPGADPIYQQSPVAIDGRVNYYGISSLGTTFRSVLDGNYYNSTSRNATGEDTLAWTQADLNRRLLEPAQFSIGLEVNGLSPTQAYLKATLTAQQALSSQTVLVRVAIVEEEVIVGGDTLRYVLRELLPDTAGFPITRSWSPADTQSLGQVWVDPGTYDLDEVGVVVFVQNSTTREVYQSIYAKLRDLDPNIDIDEFQEGFVSVYPNPASDRIYVAFDDKLRHTARWELLNSWGIAAQSGTVREGYSRFIIDTQALPGGVYHIRMETAKGHFERKVIVVH